MIVRFVTLALVWLVTASLAGPASTPLPVAIDGAIQEVSAVELRRYVEVLASDELAGRGVGHAGNRQAEQYIAGVLRDAHVPPASPGYFQQVEVYQPRLGPDAHLAIAAADEPPLADLGAGSDFFPLPDSSDRPASGPLVFAGHGISAPEVRHDDYSGLDARGAVVLALDGAPGSLGRAPGLSGTRNVEIATLERKIADARRHGAVALVIVRDRPGDVRTTWPERSSVRSASYRLAAPMRTAPLAVAVISERAARPARRALDRRGSLTATINPGVIAQSIVIGNVLGIIEGREAGGEMVVVGAHLDHDGIDEAGRIYNGADDNASGTAAVLAMASAFARAAASGTRPARAVVFALWNGEEKGSLGAEHYVASPVPARRMIANINLDMIGRREDIPDPADPRFQGFERTDPGGSRNVVHLLGYTYSPDLARIVERANGTIRLTIREDYDRGAQGLLYRSDHWPFLEHGVPAVFLTTGLHPDYHTPDDDTNRLDFPKLERITELASRAAWMTADGDAPGFKAK
jgi:hypothetical protein